MAKTSIFGKATPTATSDNREVFKQRVAGRRSRHLPNPVHPTLTTSSPDLPYPIPMAFNNNANDSNLHPCSSTNSAPKRPSFLDVVLNKKEGSNPQADRGGFVARSDGTVGSPRSLRARTDFGNHGRGHFDNPCQIHEYGYSASPGTSYATPTMWRDHPRHPQSYQPTTTSHSTQRYYPATLGRAPSTVARGIRDPICGKDACSDSWEPGTHR